MTTIEFDKKVVCGPEFVAVRILENCDELRVGTIWLPAMSESNARMAHCIIEDVGTKAAEEYGIKTGDYVMIDRLSTFAHTAPVAVLKYNNVICKTNADKSEFFPLRNMIFVEPDQKGEVTDVGGIAVANYAEKLNTGKITKMNCDEDKKLPFAVGDDVIVTKGADVMQLGDTTLHIFKHDMIICKVVKEG